MPGSTALQVPQALGTVRAIVRRVVRKDAGAKVIGVHWERPWTGGPVTFDVDERRCTAHYADSALAIRELLAQDHGAEILVLLTPCPLAVIGADVMSRLAFHRLHEPDRWESVLQVFGARRHDRRLNDLPLLADALIEAAPPGGFPPLLSGTLDLDNAWRSWARVVLLLPQVDAASLLRASAAQRLPAGTVNEQLVGPFLEWLNGTVSPLAGFIVKVEERLGSGGAAALGLVLAPLLAADQALRLQSMGQLTELLGVKADAVLLTSFSERMNDLGPDLFTGADSVDFRPVLDQAAALLTRLHLEDYDGASRVLPSGFDARIRAFGTALLQALEHPGAATMSALEAAVAATGEHRSATLPDGAVRCRVFDMAVRAVRWMRAPALAGLGFPEMARRYALDGSWVDVAWRALWEGDTEPVTAGALAQLTEQLTIRQRAQYHQFAATLPGSDPSSVSAGFELVPVERILERVVAPLSRSTPVLLVVLDGYALAVHHQVMADLLAQGWSPIFPTGVTGQAGVAMLPTVTHVSRASLLGGAPVVGDMEAELRAFRAAPALAHLQPKATLFHQRDLDGQGGQALAGPVVNAVAGQDPVIAVVVNTVDDTVHKGTYPAEWKLTDIRRLADLLRVAGDAGRVVVITADHGHLVQQEMKMQAPAETGGERWRPSGAMPANGQEVELRGPRVLLGDPGVAMPWADDLRYSPKKGGYHGGASPAEVMVPLVVLTRDDVPAGWVAGSAEAPPWWTRSTAIAPVVPVSGGRAPRRQEPELFPVPDATVPVVPVSPATPAWVAGVLDSAAWTQRAQGRRVVLERAQLERLLVGFEQRGGVLPFGRIAELTGVLAFRVGGLMATFATQCNVDGYAILTTDSAAQEARLDLNMLRTQFADRKSK